MQSSFVPKVSGDILSDEENEEEPTNSLIIKVRCSQMYALTVCVFQDAPDELPSSKRAAMWFSGEMFQGVDEDADEEEAISKYLTISLHFMLLTIL